MGRAEYFYSSKACFTERLRAMYGAGKKHESIGDEAQEECMKDAIRYYGFYSRIPTPTGHAGSSSMLSHEVLPSGIRVSRSPSS